MRRNIRSKKPNKGGKNTRDSQPSHQIMPLSVVRSTKRYTFIAAAVAAIDHKELLMSGGAVCTVVNNTLTAIFSSARIRRVRVWAPLSTTATPSLYSMTIALLWGGSVTTTPGSTQRQITATTMSSVNPAYIDAKPPRGTTAAWWGQTDTADNLFQLFSFSSTGAIQGVPDGTTVEVDAEFTQTSVGVPPTIAVATATLGLIYYPVLDNTGTKRMYPVGLPSTV